MADSTMRLAPALEVERRSTARWVVAGIAILYCAYAALFIYNTSVVVDGERYFPLFDDAMIGMRYAHNLATGQGLVFNSGERVQGFTNPLWVLYMALLHLLPLPLSKMPLLVSISGAVLQLITAFYAGRLAKHLFPETRGIGVLAGVLTLFYLPLNFWALEGMEVGALAALFTLSAYLLARSLPDDAPPRTAWLLLGVATLIRMDASVVFLAALLLSAVTCRANGRRSFLAGALILAAAIASQFAFSLAYYRDLLPNTYYLKVTGHPLIVRVARGLYTLEQFVLQIGIPVFLAPWFFLDRRKDRRVWLLASMFGAQVLYSVGVGGDAWEGQVSCNRYVSCVMPLFFVLVSYPLLRFAGHIAAHVETLSRTSHRRPGLAACLAAAIGLLTMNAGGSVLLLAQWTLVQDPSMALEERTLVQVAMTLRRVTTPEATLAVVSAGTLPYYSGRKTFDILGKCDPVIAHEPPRSGRNVREALDYLPGHSKWDAAYSLGVLKPDVLVEIEPDRMGVEAYASDYAFVRLHHRTIAFRKDSRAVLWPLVVQARAADIAVDGGL